VIGERLYRVSLPAARETSVGQVTIGLGYVAVRTADGGLGLCYTMIDRRACCTQVRSFHDFDGCPAIELLDYARSGDTLERSMGIALVNALNEPRAAAMEHDSGERTGIIAQLRIGAGTKVAMVGYFGPVIARMKKVGAEISVLDRDHRMGDEAHFLRDLATWPDILVLTATTMIDDSFGLFLDHVGGSTRVAVMGPSTPMIPDVYADLPVHMLAGMVARDKDRALAAVRQGGGTPALSPHSRKVFWLRDRQRAER